LSAEGCGFGDGTTRYDGTTVDRYGAWESREGAFYVVAGAEIDALMGEDAAIVRRRFGIEESGNALSDPQGSFEG
jgi:uncharacterized protein YyaL (SSP411 family)